MLIWVKPFKGEFQWLLFEVKGAEASVHLPHPPLMAQFSSPAAPYLPKEGV